MSQAIIIGSSSDGKIELEEDVPRPKRDSRRYIGVLFSPHTGTEKLRQYLNFASQYGIARLVMPDEYREDLNLLILPGGADLSATNKSFLPKFNYQHEKTDSAIEFFRTYILDGYIENNIPIFGICLGFQLLASHFGSKMFAHIDGHQEGFHTVKSNTLELKVNTFHHQAIMKLSEDLTPYATAYSKGGSPECVEAFIHKTKPIAGSQWHAERMENLLSSATYLQTGNLVGDLITHDLITKIMTR